MGGKHRRRRSKARGRKDWFKKVGVVPLGSLVAGPGSIPQWGWDMHEPPPTSKAEVKSPVTPSAGKDVKQMKLTHCCGS